MKYAAYISIIAIVIGLPLVSAPWWWPAVVGGSRAWSDAQANEYSQVAASFHHLAHESSQRTTAETSAAAARYSHQRDALQQARRAGQTAGAIMQCLGIAAVFAGLLTFSAARRDAQPE